mgnify:CR=1 FL=1
MENQRKINWLDHFKKAVFGSLIYYAGASFFASDGNLLMKFVLWIGVFIFFARALSEFIVIKLSKKMSEQSAKWIMECVFAVAVIAYLMYFTSTLYD